MRALPLIPPPSSPSRLTFTWTPSPTPPPSPRAADLFMVLFVSIFIFLTAAILRLVPWVSPVQPYARWSARNPLARPSDPDTLTAYRAYATYGALDAADGAYETLLEIGERIGSAKNGLSDEQIAILPTYRCGGAADADHQARRGAKCAICRDSYSDTELIRVLPCGDEYHSDCIAPWLKQQATCPLCRCRFA